MKVQFKGKNMLHYSSGAAFYVYTVISFIFEMFYHGLVVIMPGIQISDSGSIPGGNDMICP